MAGRDLSQPVKDFRDGKPVRLSGVEAGDPVCNLGLPSAVCARLEQRLRVSPEEVNIFPRSTRMMRRSRGVILGLCHYGVD